MSKAKPYSWENPDYSMFERPKYTPEFYDVEARNRVAAVMGTQVMVLDGVRQTPKQLIDHRIAFERMRSELNDLNAENKRLRSKAENKSRLAVAFGSGIILTALLVWMLMPPAFEITPESEIVEIE